MSAADPAKAAEVPSAPDEETERAVRTGYLAARRRRDGAACRVIQLDGAGGRAARPLERPAVEPDGARVVMRGGRVQDGLEVFAVAGVGPDGGVGAGDGQAGEQGAGGAESRSGHGGRCFVDATG